MRRLLLVVLAGLLLSVGAAPATASTRGEIFRDCQDDGQLQGSYTPSELRDARKNLPTDLREYSDCEDVLRRAELPQAPSTGGSGTPGTPPPSDGTAPPSSAPSTPQSGGAAPAPPPPGPQTDADNKALDDAKNAGEQAVTVNKRTLAPVATGIPGGRSSNDLPGALVAALVLLALAGIALSIPPLRRRFGNRLPPGLTRS